MIIRPLKIYFPETVCFLQQPHLCIVKILFPAYSHNISRNCIATYSKNITAAKSSLIFNNYTLNALHKRFYSLRIMLLSTMLYLLLIKLPITSNHNNYEKNFTLHRIRQLAYFDGAG